MDLKDIFLNTRNWIVSDQFRKYWRPLVNAESNLRVALVTSVVNDKGNEMIAGAVHRSPGLTAEENPRKPQLGDRLMK